VNFNILSTEMPILSLEIHLYCPRKSSPVPGNPPWESSVPGNSAEILPHIPDAWVDESKTKVGYEINFNRHLYKYTPPRPLDDIESDLKKIEKEIVDMLAEVTE